MSFSARFLDKVENEGRAPSFQRTKFSFLKMRNFMVILALAVEGYELSLSSVDHIARDFGIQAKEIRSYFEHVGAVRKSPAGSESSFGNQKWVLPAKPKPKTKVISAQRSQKKKSY